MACRKCIQELKTPKRRTQAGRERLVEGVVSLLSAVVSYLEYAPAQRRSPEKEVEIYGGRLAEIFDAYLQTLHHRTRRTVPRRASDFALGRRSGRWFAQIENGGGTFTRVLDDDRATLEKLKDVERLQRELKVGQR